MRISAQVKNRSVTHNSSFSNTRPSHSKPRGPHPQSTSRRGPSLPLPRASWSNHVSHLDHSKVSNWPLASAPPLAPPGHFPTQHPEGLVKYLSRLGPTSSGTLPQGSPPLPRSEPRPASLLSAMLSNVSFPHQDHSPQPQASSLARGCRSRGRAGGTHGAVGRSGAAGARGPASSSGRRWEDSQAPRAPPVARQASYPSRTPQTRRPRLPARGCRRRLPADAAPR